MVGKPRAAMPARRDGVGADLVLGIFGGDLFGEADQPALLAA